MTKTLEELEQEFDTATEALDKLKAEQRLVLQGFADAVAAKDPAAVNAYVRRRGALPPLLMEAEVTAIHAELALMDAENVVDAAKVKELKPQAAQAEIELKQAQAKLTLLQRDLGALGQKISFRQSRKQTRGNRLERLLQEQLGIAHEWPVVRSKQR